MQAKLRGSDGLASAKAAQSAGPSLCCYKPLLPGESELRALPAGATPLKRVTDNRALSAAPAAIGTSRGRGVVR
jgi:hypothetical protein